MFMNILKYISESKFKLMVFEVPIELIVLRYRFGLFRKYGCYDIFKIFFLCIIYTNSPSTINTRF